MILVGLGGQIISNFRNIILYSYFGFDKKHNFIDIRKINLNI